VTEVWLLEGVRWGGKGEIDWLGNEIGMKNRGEILDGGAVI
jgi:hypothetical protein